MKKTKKLFLMVEENGPHKKNMDNFDLLNNYNFNNKKPLTSMPQNVLQRAKRNTGAFNDLNLNFRDKRFGTHLNKFRPTRMEGNGGTGFFKHNVISYQDKVERSGLNFKINGFKEIDYDGLDLEETMAYERAALADVMGYRKLNKTAAKQQFNGYIQKTNKGGRSGGKESGNAQGGRLFREHNANIVRKDNEYKKLIEQSDTEFRTIMDGVHKARDGIDNQNIKTY